MDWKKVFILGLIVVFLAESCKKKKTFSTIPLDSMLLLEIAMMPGDNQDIFSDSLTNFVGLPAAVGYHASMPELPFLLLGKNLNEKKKYMSHFLGSMRLQFKDGDKEVALALPVDDKYKSIHAENYDEFSMNYPQVKLWISDWFRYSYSMDELNKISWHNEINIFRKFALEKE